MDRPRSKAPPDIVIFDLDGTLADIQHRRYLVECESKKWREFYALCVNDKVNYPVAVMFDALRRQGYKLWVVSGRSDEVIKETKEWLRYHSLVPDHLLMRVAKDHQPDVKLKQMWLVLGLIPKERVLCVFDDRDSVVKMWREEGLACFQVAPGNF